MSVAATSPSLTASAPAPTFILADGSSAYPRALSSRFLATAAAISISLIGTNPSAGAVTSSPWNGIPENVRPWFPAMLTQQVVQARADEFAKLLIEAIDLSHNMVAASEGDALNEQTIIYAVQSLVPLVTSMALPPALILPLENGGLSVEWHSEGLNIELRFRKAGDIYALLEDARGEIAPHHDRDSYLVKSRAALQKLAERTIGQI